MYKYSVNNTKFKWLINISKAHGNIISLSPVVISAGKNRGNYDYTL